MITHPKSSPIETVCQLLPPSSQFYQRPQCTHFFFCSLSYPHLFLFSKLTPFAKSGKVCFCCLHQMTLIDTAPKTNCKLYPRKSINCLQLPKSNFPGLKMLRSTGHLLYFMEAQEVGLVCIFTASISILPSVKPQWEVFSQPFPGEVMIFPKPLRQNLLIII